jgi:Fe-S-cluster-containing dehydrogenase component
MSKLIKIGQHRAADHQPLQWRSVGEVDGSADIAAQLEAESPNGQLAAEQALASHDGVSRRGFMGGAGITLAAAASALSGCIRKPTELVVPSQNRPEDLVPGKPVWFATSARFGDQVLGLLVESQEGRPTKIEGNPKHPDSLGGTTPQAQASVLDLYDPDRSRSPYKGREPVSWDTYERWADAHFEALHRAGGEGFAVVLDDTRSPTVLRLLSELRSRFGHVKVYIDDVGRRSHSSEGSDQLGLGVVSPRYDLEGADVIVALDADILGSDGDSVRYSKEFASRRRTDGSNTELNRLYAVEPRFSITGMMADNRLRLRSGLVGEFLFALAGELFTAGAKAPPGALGLVSLLGGRGLPDRARSWAKAVAKDLVSKQGRSAVIVGERQPAHVHAVAHLVNVTLGNLGRTFAFIPRHEISGARGLPELAKAIEAGEVTTLLTLGTNPVYDAPGDLDLAAAVGKVEHTVHLGSHFDETAAVCDWHLPESHFLEAWGDHRASDGSVSVQQPLIAPLYETRTAIELLARLVSSPHGDGMRQTKATWAFGTIDDAFELEWRRWLHDGVIAETAATPISPVLTAPNLHEQVEGDGPGAAPPQRNSFGWSRLGQTLSNLEAPVTSGIEVAFFVDPTIQDGRYANNSWLQELPDQITKLVWDNAALLSPATARRLGVSAQDGLPHRGDKADLVAVTVGGASVELPAWVTPGLADDVVVLNLGYGRDADLTFGYGPGFDVSPVRTSASPWFVAGDVKKVKGGYELCSSQGHNRLVPREGYERRPFVREATLEHFKEDPHFVEKEELVDTHHLKSLFEQSNVQTGQQWGMSIDLNTCTGCGNCVVACQSENNIQTVGKERVGYGREMHWIRIDRYFTGDMEEPEAVVQPMACSHCELAPCEQVCPVAATAHSPEGLNDMAYNRCIGTRYCANNCPYKVRRYNFFNYSKEQDQSNPMLAFQRNPDVTVRFRGVMEKCTYCVQRINAEKIVAKREGDGVVPDGRIVPACGQSCPTDAIVFGDINDPDSAVSKAKARPQEYALLSELNIKPRTTYGAKVRNPNPDLA